MRRKIQLPPGATRNDCPFCGSNAWQLHASALGVRILPIIRAKPRYARVVTLFCRKCGFLRFQHPNSFYRQAPADSGRVGAAASTPSARIAAASRSFRSVAFAESK